MTVVDRAVGRDLVEFTHLTCSPDMVDVTVGEHHPSWAQVVSGEGLLERLDTSHSGIDDDGVTALLVGQDVTIFRKWSDDE